MVGILLSEVAWFGGSNPGRKHFLPSPERESLSGQCQCQCPIKIGAQWDRCILRMHDKTKQIKRHVCIYVHHTSKYDICTGDRREKGRHLCPGLVIEGRRA